MIDNLIDFIKNEENLAEVFLRSHKNSNRVYLYGAGEALVWYVEYLSNHGIVIESIVVSNDLKEKTQKMGLPLISINDMDWSREDYEFVISAPKYKKEIIDILRDKVNANRIFSFEAELYCTFVHSISCLREYYVKNYERLEYMYNNLQDNLSKRTFEAFIKGRISGNQDYYQEIRVDDLYYSTDIIKLTEDEVLVELGSNNGDTLKDFLNRVNRKYKKCICFEPDEQCARQIKRLISQEDGNIQLHEKGAYDCRGTLLFSVNGNDEKHSTAHISEFGEGVGIEVDTIDNCVDEKITFLKMDIEGSELRALLGGKNTIKSYMPKIAVSVYHNNEDLLDIYEYIRSISSEYKFYLRHYNHSATDTVLYAIV